MCSTCDGGILIAIGGELRAISLGRRFVNASGKFCCIANMKGQTSKNWRSILVSILWTRLTLENWRAKLVSLILAMATPRGWQIGRRPPDAELHVPYSFLWIFSPLRNRHDVEYYARRLNFR